MCQRKATEVERELATRTLAHWTEARVNPTTITKAIPSLAERPEDVKAATNRAYFGVLGWLMQNT